MTNIDPVEILRIFTNNLLYAVVVFVIVGIMIILFRKL